VREGKIERGENLSYRLVGCAEESKDMFERLFDCAEFAF
jgi:hypothetical protein